MRNITEDNLTQVVLDRTDIPDGRTKDFLDALIKPVSYTHLTLPTIYSV